MRTATHCWRSNQSILKEISPEYSLEGLMIKLKSHTLATCCEELIHWKRPWCWERLRVGKGATEDEMVGWHHQLNGHEFEQTPGDSEGQGSLSCCSPWGCRVRHNWATQQQWQIVVKKTPAHAGDTHLIPGPGESHMPQSNKAFGPQPLKPANWEPVLCKRRNHYNEKPEHRNKG